MIPFFTPKDKPAKIYECEAPIAISHEMVGVRPVDYKIPDEYDLFKATFDDGAKEMLNSGKPDMYNDCYYDAVIEAQTEKALEFLAQQRISHYRTVYRIYTARESAIHKLDNELERLKEIIDSLEKELAY